MVRSMYSGVAGMKAQQAAMDVIGNNIANVRTYGFKSSRATFRDVYYSTVSGASGATNNRGGTNSSQIGYGAQLSSVDIMQSQSSFSSTGRSMDVAIAGEGFLQVQDPDGNIFYTRAGQLIFDSAGNLVDSMGNFVLGVSGDPLGADPSSDKIQIAVPPVEPTASESEDTINSIKFSIKASKNTSAGNVSFTFAPDDEIPGGQKAKAELTGGGTGITIKLNPSETFDSLADLNKAINDAITEANGGEEHPAGSFEVAMENGTFPAGGLTGKEITSKDYSSIPGKFEGWDSTKFFGGMNVVSTSSDFTVTDGTNHNMTMVHVPAAGDVKEHMLVEFTVDGKVYKGKIDEELGKKDFTLTSDAGDHIIMSQAGLEEIKKKGVEGAPGAAFDFTTANAEALTALGAVTATSAEKSKNIGMSSKVMKLSGGTEGGAQGIENVDSIAIGKDGIITAKHGVHGEITVGRIDLATFANAQGLEQAGNTYFKTTANSGNMSYCQPGTEGSGSLAGSSLEQSNVDLSQEFSDMITTQRAYQANSRMITVSDTMLEELVNLKR